jgi:plastocyanin
MKGIESSRVFTYLIHTALEATAYIGRTAALRRGAKALFVALALAGCASEGGGYPTTSGGGGTSQAPASGSETTPPPAATASASPAPGASAAAATVDLTGASFAPGSVTIKVGQKVRWVWRSGMHNVVSGKSCSPDGKFSSGNLQTAPATFEHTFDAPGTYDYYCDPHCGMGMVGKVVVQ